MQATASANNTTTKHHKRQSHGATFAKVFNARKQQIRALWQRNGRFYAQLTVEDENTGEKKTRLIPLVDQDGKPVDTVAQAQAELDRLKTQRADGILPTSATSGQADKFKVFADTYLTTIAGAKKSRTVAKEGTILKRWKKAVGHLRLDQIKRVHVNRFIAERLNAKANPRTINLDVIGLRNVLKRAMQDGLIQRLPTEGLRPLRTTTPKRPLFSAADLDKLCAAAEKATKNAQQFTDYVKLMAYCGARRDEALALRWKRDVDFEREQLTIGAAGDTKNSEHRTVDFNPKLKAHLLAMKTRRAPEEWLFPSPQRGEKDIHAKSFRESLEMVREAAEMADFTFHDCRHHFISMCVMSGIDFMTIAAWVGHKDGGVLIGKVYGHLANEHRKAMADKLNFGPMVMKEAM